MRTWFCWGSLLSWRLSRRIGWLFLVIFIPCGWLLSYSRLRDNRVFVPQRSNSRRVWCSILLLARSLLFSLDCWGSSTCYCNRSVRGYWWHGANWNPSPSSCMRLLSSDLFAQPALSTRHHWKTRAGITYPTQPTPMHMVLDPMLILLVDYNPFSHLIPFSTCHSYPLGISPLSSTSQTCM